jgi:peptide/nickel transport system permease protein
MSGASGVSARRRGWALPRVRARGGERRQPRRGALIAGIAILASVTLLSVVVPAFGPRPDSLVGEPLQPPSGHHLFGLDAYGRDVWVRTWAAGRLDLIVAAVGSGVSLAVGTIIGMFVGGIQVRWVAAVATRVIDAVIAFPFIILALTLTLVIGNDRSFGPLPPGVPAVLVAVVAVNWTIFARLARAEVLSLRSRDFVVAARLLGYSRWRIQLRHLLPAVLRTTAAYAVNNAVLLIIITASLAFLGAGAQPPAAEWGALMYAGRTVLNDAWWITVMPGLVLALTALATSLIGDWLLAPKSGRSAG